MCRGWCPTVRRPLFAIVALDAYILISPKLYLTFVSCKQRCWTTQFRIIAHILN